MVYDLTDEYIAQIEFLELTSLLTDSETEDGTFLLTDSETEDQGKKR